MTKQWVDETESQIKAIERELQVIDEEYDKLGRERTAKNEALNHWRAVLQDYKKRQGLEMPQPSLFLQQPDAYKNLSHREIVCLIRDQNEGNIPMKQLTQVLKAKVVNPDHASGSAYTIVRRLEKQGKLTKLRPGVYRWVNGAVNGTVRQ